MITVNVVSGSSAIGAHKTEKINFYPNPAANEVVLELPESGTVQIFDLSGRKVLGQNLSGKTILDVSQLNEGLYTISIKSGEKTLTRKLTIVR